MTTSMPDQVPAEDDEPASAAVRAKRLFSKHKQTIIGAGVGALGFVVVAALKAALDQPQQGGVSRIRVIDGIEEATPYYGGAEPDRIESTVDLADERAERQRRREHTVRSHERHYKNGNVVQIPEHTRGIVT